MKDVVFEVRWLHESQLITLHKIEHIWMYEKMSISDS